jgi:hypothetical protein
MCVCVCVCMYIYIYIYLREYMHVCVHMNEDVKVRICPVLQHMLYT